MPDLANRKIMRTKCPSPMISWRGAFAALLFSIAIIDATAAQPAAQIEQKLVGLATGKGQTLAGHHVASVALLKELYATLRFQPAWSRPENVSALKEAIAESWIEGLLPEDFHAKALGIRVAAPVGGLSEVERDILMSDGLIRLLYQLYFGKVDPNTVDANWNFKRPLLKADAAATIAKALADGEIKDLIRRLRLEHPFYSGLKSTLQAYTEYAARGGWQPVPDGPPVKPGSTDPRVALVRARLTITGEYEPKGDPSSPVYDDDLAAAVKRFQREHGLEDQGLIGSQTLKALNVTAEQRIEQIRVNMERARWVLREAIDAPDLVLVNVAGFYLSLHLDGKRVWSTDVIVGKSYTKTPIFTETMKYVVVNPDWTLPRSIIRGEVVPKAKANPSYLAANSYDLVNGSGARVSPQSVDWAALSPQSFPYSVVQRPGPRNALGLVKFMFPNRHNVYLHDTPSRGLFAKTGRTFSHGCIRVKDPLRMAEIILGNRAGWDRARIDTVVASGRTQQINLSKPLPVLILYWTVDPNFDGSARFYDDIYGRDAKLLKALNGPFRPAAR